MPRYRFDRFDLDADIGELRRDGLPVKLQPQPLKVLSLLVSHADRLVTRDALQSAIWPDGTFVDFQRGLNFCVAQIRGVLGDDAGAPRFIETVPRRGYRFVAPVQMIADARPRLIAADEAASASAAPASPAPVSASGSALASASAAATMSRAAAASASPSIPASVLPPLSQPVPAAPAPAPAWGGTPGGESVASGAPPPPGPPARSRWTAGRVMPVALVVLTALTTTLMAFAFAPSARLTSSSGVRWSTRELANEAFVNGQYLARKGSRDDLLRALAQFQRAAAEDPRFAAAEAAVAETAVRLVLSGRAAPLELMPVADGAATRALALDAELAEAHAALGSVRLWFDWTPVEAARHFERALRLDPRHAAARHDHGWALIAQRRFDEGVREIRTAQKLDPLSPRATIDVGWALLRTGRYADAVAQSRRALELEPDFPQAQSCLEVALRLNGQFADAVDVARAAWRGAEPLPPRAADPLRALAQIDEARLARLRRAGETSTASSRTSSTSPNLAARAPSAYIMAVQLAMAGRADEALVWLGRAYEERSPMMATLPLDPAFGPALGNLRGVPAFAALVDRVGGRSSKQVLHRAPLD